MLRHCEQISIPRLLNRTQFNHFKVSECLNTIRNDKPLPWPTRIYWLSSEYIPHQSMGPGSVYELQGLNQKGTSLVTQVMATRATFPIVYQCLNTQYRRFNRLVWRCLQIVGRVIKKRDLTLMIVLCEISIVSISRGHFWKENSYKSQICSHENIVTATTLHNDRDGI